jgi:formamidopyrimidine-DNA glycosylase
MPELPEVETIRRGLTLALEGKRITDVDVRRRDLRIPLPDDFESSLAGRRVEALGRRGKYLVLALGDGHALIIHLGMSGRMLIEPASRRSNVAALHEHVVFTLEDGSRIRFTDPRRFGLMALAELDSIESHPFFLEMGPEPLSEAFNGEALYAAIKEKRTPIKAALLDQHVVAGLGNIYVCEALYRAGISPRRLAMNVGRARVEKLVEAIRAVLLEAIEAGGSTLKDYARADGELGYFQHRFAVYDRAGEPCPDCDCDIGVAHIVQSNRSTFYCAKRQR